MTNGPLEAVLRRDRLIVASALGVIAALAWAYVLWLAALRLASKHKPLHSVEHSDVLQDDAS